MMGRLEFQDIAMGIEHETSKVSTALMILVVLQKQHPRPMTTYEIGLWVRDTKQPARPLSVIMKTLSHDGYIIKRAKAGKRSVRWALTLRGLKSLRGRIADATSAEAWIALYPNFSQDEMLILRSLFTFGAQSPARLSLTCSIRLSPVRTALKRLFLRRFIVRSSDFISGYGLTEAGLHITKRISLISRPDI